jgi:hypothetical protein
MTTITTPCGKNHRTWSAHLRCIFRGTLMRHSGEGQWALVDLYDIPFDRGFRWHGASRVHVTLYSTREEAEHARPSLHQIRSGTHRGARIVNLTDVEEDTGALDR